MAKKRSVTTIWTYDEHDDVTHREADLNVQKFDEIWHVD